MIYGIRRCALRYFARGEYLRRCKELDAGKFSGYADALERLAARHCRRSSTIYAYLRDAMFLLI